MSRLSWLVRKLRDEGLGGITGLDYDENNDEVDLTKTLNANGNNVSNAFIETGGSILQNVTIASGENVYHQLSEGGSLTVTSSITVNGNLRVYEL